MCPTSSDQVLQMLDHFENARMKNPLGTKAIIALPALNMQLTKKWKLYLNKYQLIHQYPAGTYLFTCPHSDIENECITPISWPMNIFLADYIVEDRLHQSTMDAQSAANEKLAAVLTEMEQRQNRTTIDLTVEVPCTSGRSEKLYSFFFRQNAYTETSSTVFSY